MITDAKRILLASPPVDWRRQPCRPRIMWLSTVEQDLKHHLTLPEAAYLAHNHPMWRMMSTYGTTRFSSCMPEMTTTSICGLRKPFYNVLHVFCDVYSKPDFMVLALRAALTIFSITVELVQDNKLIH